jgi:regulator of cell morphogenesis and NO signaling
MKIHEIIRHQPLGLKILNKYGLDYAACRHLSLEDACESCSINPAHIKQELLEQKKSRKKNLYPIDQVMQTALQQHDIVKKQLDAVYPVLDAVIEHEPAIRPELLEIRTSLVSLAESLEMHLFKEKEMLFPEFIKQFRKQSVQDFSILYPIERLEHEHGTAAEILEEMRKLRTSSRFTAKQSNHMAELCYTIGCLENALVALINFENNLLFPQLVALETQGEDST